MYIDLIVMKRAIEFKQLIFVAENKGHKHKDFQTDDMGIRYNCAKRNHVLYIHCAKGIIFGFGNCANVIIKIVLICHLLLSITR